MAPVNVECPIEDCDYTATHAEPEAAVVAAMLSVHATVHVAVPRALGANTKMEKLKRPSVALAGTGEAWSYFITRWGEYKTGTKLVGPDIVVQLLECCEEELRKDLSRTAGKSLMSSDEKDVLTAMKAFAIRAENTMVARVALSNMRQGHEEPIRSFYARIKGQADTCKYEMKCTKTECEQVNDFTEEIIRNVIARGIADQEIQLDLLGEKNQDMPLKNMIEYFEAKESGKRSASRLLDPQSTDAISSSYRRGKQQDVRNRGGARPEKPKAKPKGVCIYCGEVGHGKTPLWHTRRTECPAYGKKCQKCGRNGIILNPEKFVFSAPTVDFAGFTITTTDVRPCSRYLEAIRDFPQPRNITDIRSWFGLVNQVAYAFSMAERMHPFRKLLNNGKRFTWSPELEDIFRESKVVIVQEIERGVRTFDKTKPTCIATDWSKEGIGFWLFQKHCRCSPIRPFLQNPGTRP